MDHEHRNCPRCRKPAGDFHFCPSCLAPVDSPSAISTGRSEHTLAASAGDRNLGQDSTAVLEVDAEAPASADVTAQPTVAPDKAPGLQLRLDGRASVAPPAPRDVARLEDVLTIGTKRVAPHLSVPPPAPRAVARLEDVLTIRPEDAPQIAPKTAAAVETVAEVQAVAEETPAAEASPPPIAEVKPATARGRPAADRRYVPAYALRAAFWFEQASAFESGTDDDEDAEIAIAAPEVEQVQLPAEVSQIVIEAASAETPVETPRKHWILALCLLAVGGLAIALTGRRPCRCSCHGPK